jgi:hypothetical protein
MGNVANFTVIRDAWTTGLYDGVDFEVNSAISAERRTVLTFMLRNFSEGDVTVSVKVNGKKVWNWKFTEAKTRFYQEVLGADVIRPGTNKISCEVSRDSDGKFDFAGVEFSDIVLWYRVSI